MNSIIIMKLISCGLLCLIGYIFWIGSKIFITIMICNHPELTDDKVKYITEMMSQNNHGKFN